MEKLCKQGYWVYSQTILKGMHFLSYISQHTIVFFLIFLNLSKHFVYSAWLRELLSLKHAFQVWLGKISNPIQREKYATSPNKTDSFFSSKIFMVGSSRFSRSLKAFLPKDWKYLYKIHIRSLRAHLTKAWKFLFKSLGRYSLRHFKTLRSRLPLASLQEFWKFFKLLFSSFSSRSLEAAFLATWMLISKQLVSFYPRSLGASFIEVWKLCS